jgi:hypothetical protein
MNTFDDVMLDRALLSLLDGAEVDWTDDVPDLNQEWAVEELTPEALKAMNW